MKLRTSLKLALNFLLHSKLRSWLTIIGIVIGVSAVVAIISIGEGMQQSVQAHMGGLGAEVITLSPGGGRAQMGFMRAPEFGGPPPGFGGGSSQTNNLTQKDIQVLRSIENVAYIGGTISGRGEAYYLGEKATLQLQGVDPFAWSHITTSELDSGRFLNPSESGAVVIGSRVATSTFKQPILLNRQLTIEGKNFKVIGILKQGEEDSRILMSLEDARNTIPDIDKDNLNSIVIKAVSVDAVEQVMADADSKLMLSRHITSNRRKDYTLTSMQAMQERVQQVTETMTLFLTAIAAVSLIVGAVGIANTMFTSVLEKTKDIGIMKAIGAKNRDIMIIFLFNSALVGVVGGLLGIGLGALVSAWLPTIGLRLMGGGGDMKTAISLNLMIFVMLLSTAIGIIAGIVPAYRASRLQPVDALRYE